MAKDTVWAMHDWDTLRRNLIKRLMIMTGFCCFVYLKSPFFSCVLLIGGYLGAFYHYIIQRDREIQQIIDYLQSLNQGVFNYELSAYDEGSLNRLKSELHKTMMILKNSYKTTLEQKIFLKKSLEDISHQLKTPITALHILNELQDESDELVARSTMQIKRLSTLTHDLLTLSKLEAGVVEFKKEASQTRFLIQNVLDQTQPIIIKNKLIINTDSASFNVLCDRTRTHEALMNVFSNKFFFAQTTITIKSSYTGINTYIVISDDGPTIPISLREKVFERFYTGTQKRADSVGIGLAIAKETMLQQGGDLFIDSEGSFVFVFSQ